MVTLSSNDCLDLACTPLRNMTKQVLGAPLGFFESTPVGRLIQRFSKDLDQIDQQLPSSLGQVSFSPIGHYLLLLVVYQCPPPNS
jgi:ABC-type multidrug transport system fused ATPase/permease subunit